MRRLTAVGLSLLVGVFAVVALAGPAGDAISAMEATIAALQQAVSQLQAELAALTQRVTALEEGGPPPQPPVTYPLVLNTSGTGQGSVDSSSPARAVRQGRRLQPRAAEGDYAAGEAVTLTATPAAGSTFVGWSPAPCAPTFVMPAAALTCTATFTTSAPPVAAIILDTGQPGTTFTGSWSPSGAAGQYGANSLYATGAGVDTYRWTPTLAAGPYEVAVWWTAYYHRSAAVPYTVRHAGGTFAVSKNQQTGGGQWQVLGTFNFDAGTAGYVEVTDSGTAAGSTVAADAVRFTPTSALPPTYPLTLSKAGTGQGTVSAPAPMYAAGAAVVLTATPASGATFTGWTPTPCAPTFAMPAAALTCTATFTITAPVTGTRWERLATGEDAQGAFNFTSLSWDTQRNMAIATSWEYDPWCFDNNVTWTKCGVRGSPGYNFHNGGYQYDPHNDRYWVSTASGTEPVSRMVYWQRATGVHVNHSEGGCGMDPALIYHPAGKRFICFGGWSVPTDTPRVMLFPLDPPPQTWTIQATPGGPLFQDAAGASKMTFTRSGWDAKRSNIWYVDQNLDFWTLDPVALTWTKQVTTGTKPDKFGVFGYHQEADKIVAFVGIAGNIVGGEGSTGAIRKTYALDRSTFVWTEILPASEAVPAAISNAQMQMIYDPVNKRVLLHTGTNYNRETWALILHAQTAAGGCLPTVKQTFMPCTPQGSYEYSPFVGGSKDIMWTWDSTRNLLVFGLGDSPGPYTGGSGNTMVWTYDASTNAWNTIATFCQAADSVSPNFPSDYGIMVYDRNRDRIWWLGQGDGFPPGKEGQPCVSGTPQGSIRRNGWMWLNPTANHWTKTSEQSTVSTGGAYFDTQGDQAINIESENGYVTAHAMDPMPAVKTKIATMVNIGPTPKWVGGQGGWNTAEYTNRVKFAWDDVNRIAYIPTIYQHYSPAGGSPDEEGIWMVAVNVATKTATLKARAPRVGTGGVNVNAYHTMTVWDSVNRKVIWPVQQDTCGKIHHMLVYDPATDTWEETPVPPQTHGATVAYDPVRNVVVLAGHVFCPDQSPPQDPGPTRMWLWRYGP